MKSKRIIQTYLLLFMSFIFMTCEKEDLTNGEDAKTEVSNSENLKLLPSTPNPFLLSNIKNAYGSLLKNRSAKLTEMFKEVGVKGFETNASHYYSRFTPKDSLQYETLVNDTILAVSETILNHNDGYGGDKDEDIVPRDSMQVSSLYSVYSPKHKLPGDIQISKIHDMYFPPEDSDEIYRSKNEILLMDSDFYDFLEMESFKLTSNLDNEELKELRFFNPKDGESPNPEILTWAQAQELGYKYENLEIDYKSLRDIESRRRKWRPRGRITVTEDALPNHEPIGVMGARVYVRKWGFLVIRRAHTNRNGDFATSRTRTKRVKYAVYFKNRHKNFVIKAGTLFWNARYRDTRKYKRRAWYPNFTNGTRRYFYALVHNGTYDYYDRIYTEYGISRPGPIYRRMKINAKYNMNGSNHSSIYGNLWSEIRIGRNSNGGSYRNSDGVYATTIHELTHAGHKYLDNGIFSLIFPGGTSEDRSILTESWAEGVETIVTNDRYFDLDATYQSSNTSDFNGRWNSRRQTFTVADMNEYTPIVDDLIDVINQNGLAFAGIQPVDNVSGFTLSEIQSALDNCRTVECWEKKLIFIINDAPQEDKDDLQELFDYVQEVRDNL